MATSKVTGCFSSFTEKEFDRIESAAKALAEENGRQVPLNIDYATVAKGLLEVEQNKLAKMVEAAWAAVEPAPAPVSQAQGEASSPEGAGGSRPTPAPAKTAFEQWFGDSKVVDAGGKPLVVYHGTTSDFSVFEDRSPVSGRYMGDGFYFGDPGIASQYALQEEGSRVMPVFLSLQNPFEWQGNYRFTPEQLAKMAKVPGFSDAWKAALKEFEGSGLDVAPQPDRLAVLMREAGHGDFGKNIRAMLEAAGFDGVAYPEEGEYVAFRPEQIKSAIGNNGEFDGRNPDIRRSVASEGGSTVASIYGELNELGIKDKFGKVTVVQSVKDLPVGAAGVDLRAAETGGNVQAFVLDGKAYLIADNIRPGMARSVFLHEVGGHLGFDKLLSKTQFWGLVDRVNNWAAANDGSLESRLAQRAQKRVKAAKTPGAHMDSELLAYFVEEAVRAGVDPTAVNYKSELGRWLAVLKRAIKDALDKLGFMDGELLSAQDMVDLAYGLAHVQLQHQGTVTRRTLGEAQGAQQSIQFSIAPDAPAQAKRAYKTVFNTMENVRSKAVLLGAFTRDLARMASSVLPAAADYDRLVQSAAVEKLRAEREVDKVLEMYASLPPGERGTGPDSVNAFLRDSTMKKAWGYVPDYHPDAVVDPEMRDRFLKLSNEGKALVKAVFKHGHDNLRATKAAVEENIASEYDALIASHTAAGNAEEAAKAKEAKTKALKDYQSLMALNGDWPYAPLKRFGNHVVVGMSKAYRDAYDRNDQAALRELVEKGDHYYVAFYETKRERQFEANKLAESGQFGEGGLVQDFERDGVQDVMYGGRDTLNAFRRLRTLVQDSADGTLDTKANGAINGLMRDLHLRLLGEASARQSERERKNVAGADKDMMRAFATQGRATAHFLANLKNSGQVQEALLEMKRQADAHTPGRAERRDYYNELLRRHVMGMEYSPSPVIEKMLAGSSLWMLLTSPAYFLTNMTQPFMMSLPYLAGKHGYGKSFKAMLTAYGDVATALRGGVFREEDYGRLPEDVRAAVEALADQGAIDISLTQDLGTWESEPNGPTRHLQTATRKLRDIAQSVESINRVATAVAALRLERGANASPEQQVQYAGQVIYETHGDYTGYNSPRVMRTGIGRLVTQFRKFQLIQISLFARLGRQAWKGAKAEERQVARAALGFTLGHLFAVGGLLGMPGAQAVGWIMRQVFGDDDEPDNPELTLRKLIGDETMADLLIKGVPQAVGMNLSGRLGAGQMLSLLPYSDAPTDRKSMEAAIVAALGPFIGGLLPRFADGIGYIGQGDMLKGTELLLPKGLGDAVKTWRLSTDGMTQRNGDVVMNAEEIGYAARFWQALGLPTTSLTDRSFRASAKFAADQHYKERATEIKREYTRAYREGDASGMAEARQAWQDMQMVRAANGYTREPLSALLKAPMEQVKRERQTVGGVQYNRQNRQFVQELDEMS